MDKLNFNEMDYIIAEATKILINEITVKDAYDRFYADIPANDWDNIINTLQDNNNVLQPETKWALGLYKKKSPRFMEDLYKLHNGDNNGYLDIFKRLKTINKIQGADGDLGRYKSISELGAFVSKKMEEIGDDEIWGDNTYRKKKNMSDAQKEAKDDIKKLYEDNEWLIITPLSYEASVYWGSGTEWCTAYKDDRHYYDEYAKEGTLYINIHKPTGNKYQFHFESESFMNKYDESIDRPVFKTLGMDGFVLDFYEKNVDPMLLNSAYYECIWEGYGKKRYVKREFDEERGDYIFFILNENRQQIAGPFLWVEDYSFINDVIHVGVTTMDNLHNIVDVDGNFLSPHSFKSAIRYIGNGIIAGAEVYGEWRLYKDGEPYIDGVFNGISTLKGNKINFIRIKYKDDENFLNIETKQWLLDNWVAAAGDFVTPESTWVSDYGYGSYYLIDNEGKRLSENYWYIFRNYHMFHKELPYAARDRYKKYMYLTIDGKEAFDKWFCEMPTGIIGDRDRESKIYRSSYYNDTDYTCIPCEIYGPGKVKPINESINAKEAEYIITEVTKALLQEISVKDAYTSYYKEIPQDVFEILIEGIQGNNDIMLGLTRQMLELYKKSGETAKQAMVADASSIFRNRTGVNKPKDMGLLDRWERAILKGVFKGNDKNPARFLDYFEWRQAVLELDVDEIFLRTPGEWSRAVKQGRDEIEIPYEDVQWKIIIPLTMEAACYWGNNASWCTATRNERSNYFNRYNSDGPLYININKETGEKYQFSLPNNEYKNEENESIDTPVLNNIDASKGMIEFYKKLTADDWEKSFDLLYNTLDDYDYIYIECIETEVATITRENTEKNVTEWNAYSKGGGLISEQWFKWVEEPNYAYRITRVRFFDNSYGILDLEIGRVIAQNYEYINSFEPWNEEFDNIYYSIAIRDGKQGVMVYNGEQDNLYQPENYFDNISYDEGNYGHFKVKKNGKYGYLDINGYILGDMFFDEVEDFDSDGNAMVIDEGLVNWLDYEGYFINEDWAPLTSIENKDEEEDEII